LHGSEAIELSLDLDAEGSDQRAVFLVLALDLGGEFFRR
jgi:hypothetical protein